MKMSDFEKELVSIIKFRPNDYKDRQDYLAALARAADKWFAAKDKDQKIFDGLEDGLQGWFEDAITAMNSRPPTTIPDFPDLELEEPEAEAEPDEEEDADDENVDSGAGDSDQEVQADVEASGQDTEVTAPEAKTKKAKKEKSPTRYDGITGHKDRYGITIGTKKHEAAKMYERGTTAVELMAALGGRHYNMLRELAKDGHRVEKLAGGGFKLTHKSDIPKKGE